jgi:hypothetical protein
MPLPRLEYGYHLHVMHPSGSVVYVYSSRDLEVDSPAGYTALVRALIPYIDVEYRRVQGHSLGVRKILLDSYKFFKDLSRRYRYRDEPEDAFNRFYVRDQIDLHEEVLRMNMEVIENV